MDVRDVINDEPIINDESARQHTFTANGRPDSGGSAIGGQGPAAHIFFGKFANLSIHCGAEHQCTSGMTVVVPAGTGGPPDLPALPGLQKRKQQGEGKCGDQFTPLSAA